MNKNDLHLAHPDLIFEDPDVDVRDAWLPLINEFFVRVREIYSETEPAVCLYSAFDDKGLVIDLDDRPWSGNQDPELKRQVRQMAMDFQRRSRDV